MPSKKKKSPPPEKPAAFHRRYAVILFADLVGCSEISNEHEVEEYSKILHQFYAAGHLAYRAVNDLRFCFKKENSFFQYAGDEICAFLFLDKEEFNIQDCGERISQALWYAFSLKFFWYLSQYNLLRMKNHLAPRELGIGIHFGPVAEHNNPPNLMDHQRHRDVEGYAINLAKRIESSSHDALDTRIYMSSECEAVARTDEGCKDHLDKVALEAIKVKFDPKNISTYRTVYELQPDKGKGATGKYSIQLFDSIAGMENLLEENEIKELLELCDLKCEIAALEKLSERISIIREKQKLYPDNYWVKVITDTEVKEQPKRVVSDNEILTKARVLYSEGVYVKALKYFQQLKEDKEFMKDKEFAFETLFSLGRIYLEMKEHEKAVTEYQELNELKPDDPKTLVNWNIALSALGKHEEAIAKIKRAHELRPNDPNIIMGWGVALSRQGKYEEALEKFKRSDELGSNDPYTQYNWGLALTCMKKFEDAIEKYKRANELGPKNQAILINWGAVLGCLGKFEEAIEKFERANDLKQDNPENIRNWGSALCGLGKFEEAIEKYKRTNELMPNDPDTLMNWGVALAQFGNLDEALIKFKRAYELDSRNINVVENLIKCLINLGRGQEAEELKKKHPELGDTKSKNKIE